MDVKRWGAISLTGGTDGALDEIDGDDLDALHGHDAEAITPAGVYFYTLDPTSGLAESSPDVIAPNVHPGAKRWIRVPMLKSNLADPLYTFADGDTTPDVSAGSNAEADNSSPTTITNFDNSYCDDQVLHIVFAGGNTWVQSNGNIKLMWGANFGESAQYEHLTLRLYSGVWIEQSRSLNR